MTLDSRLKIGIQRIDEILDTDTYLFRNLYSWQFVFNRENLKTAFDIIFSLRYKIGCVMMDEIRPILTHVGSGNLSKSSYFLRISSDGSSGNDERRWKSEDTFSHETFDSDNDLLLCKTSISSIWHVIIRIAQSKIPKSCIMKFFPLGVIVIYCSCSNSF